jgi:uncharacterized membrane protein
MPDSVAQEQYLLWVERTAAAIELLAIALIAAFILIATLSWLAHAARARVFALEKYEQYRTRLGRALLLGLEILVAADIIRTVALRPTLVSVSALGLLVVVRTFLSRSIVLEVEGRWPWQARRESQARDSQV